MFDNQEAVMYDVFDIQRILKIGRTSAYKLMVSDGFPSIRLNRKVLISKEKFEEWIEKQAGKSYFF